MEAGLILGMAGLFAGAFICAALLRSSGVRGLLAVIGLAGIAFHLYADFEGWQLAGGIICALVGLTLGAKVSDYFEYQRMMKSADSDKSKRKRSMDAA